MNKSDGINQANNGRLEELMESIEAHIAAAEAHLDKMIYTEHQELSAANAMLAASLALVGMLEAMMRIQAEAVQYKEQAYK